MRVVTRLIACFIFLLIGYMVSASTFKNWLIERNYDRSVRPNFDGKYNNTLCDVLQKKVSGVNVTVQIYVHSIGPLNEQDFTFQAGIYLRQWWIDPRLINITDTTLRATNLEDFLWIPDTSIFDALQEEGFKNSIRTVIKPNGQVYVSKRLRIKISCEMDLRKYPMDTQICPLTLENYAFMTNDIEIFWHTNSITRKDNLVLDGYELIDVTRKTTLKGSLIGNETQYFKLLHSYFKVKRSIIFHIYRSFVPSVLLLAFAIGSFWVPDTAVPARMGMIVTSFLASVFILQGVSERTVKVNYSTPMQVFLLVNVILIVVSLVEYLMVLYFRHKNTGVGVDEDKNIILENHIMSKNAQQQTKDNILPEHVLTNEEKNNNTPSLVTQTQKNSKDHVHLLDKLARFASVVGYAIFCAAFFAYYFD